MKIIYLSLNVLALVFALCEYSVYASPRNIRGVGVDRELKSKDSKDNRDNSVSFPVVPLPAPVPVPAPAVPTNNVVDVMSREGGFQTLIFLLYSADLVNELTNPAQEFTIFAPMNQALPSGQAMANFIVTEHFRRILTYHVVPGGIRSTDLFDGARLTTVEGSEVVISLTNSPMVNDATIVGVEMEADNGIIHAIDKLLVLV